MQAKLAYAWPKYSYLWMPAPSSDPYETLGVSRGASDADLHAAYRRLVQLHHPDHNNGSPESAARFEQIQEAYAQVREQREHPRRADEARPRASADEARPRASADEARPRASADPDLDARVGDIERELREARAARERARRAASEAAATGEGRPTDEELGRVSTDDSFAKVLADGLEQLADRLKRRRDT
jgi:DnaJ-class molecular chaperone